MENAGEPTVNTENWTFRDLIGNSGTLTSKTHPNTYRLRFNKILENFFVEIIMIMHRELG